MKVLDLMKLLEKCRLNDDVVFESYTGPGEGIVIDSVVLGVPCDDDGDTTVVLKGDPIEVVMLKLNKDASDIDGERLMAD